MVAQTENEALHEMFVEQLAEDETPDKGLFNLLNELFDNKYVYEQMTLNKKRREMWMDVARAMRYSDDYGVRLRGGGILAKLGHP